MANNELSWMERHNLTPGKIGLIGTLAVAFLGIVGYQLAPLIFRGGPAPPPVTQQTRPNSPAAKPKAPARTNNDIPPPPPHLTRRGSSRALPSKRAGVVWPQIRLAEAVKYDPFQMPESLRAAILRQQQLDANQAVEVSPDESIAKREEFLESLAERGVDVVIFDSNNNAIAAIGDLELRVGDVVEGLLVKSISRNGIELVRVDPQPRQGEP